MMRFSAKSDEFSDALGDEFSDELRRILGSEHLISALILGNSRRVLSLQREFRWQRSTPDFGSNLLATISAEAINLIWRSV